MTWRSDDRGSASVTIAIVFPAIATLFLALTQAVMVSVARDVAQAAAEEGLRVARAHRGSHAAGQAAADGFARREPVSGSTTLTVRVTGHAPTVLPGMHIAVSRTARGARERFTTPQQP
jgi:hypothetical protein